MFWFEDNDLILSNVRQHPRSLQWLKETSETNALFGFSDQLAISHRLSANTLTTRWWVLLLLVGSKFLSCRVGASDGCLEAPHVRRLCEEKVFVGENDIWGTGNYASRRQRAWRAEQWGHSTWRSQQTIAVIQTVGDFTKVLPQRSI